MKGLFCGGLQPSPFEVVASPLALPLVTLDTNADEDDDVDDDDDDDTKITKATAMMTIAFCLVACILGISGIFFGGFQHICAMHGQPGNFSAERILHLHRTTHLFAFFTALTPNPTSLTDGKESELRALNHIRNGTANENVRRPCISMALVVVSAARMVDDT